MKIARKSPELLILIMTIGAGISWAVWLNLLNNFAIEKIDFNGAEMGILQSLREVPGFLAFTVIFVLAFVREQKLAYISIALMGLGVMVTGLVEINMTFYLATIVMSIGFHYFETISSSLTLQWIDKDKTAEFLGRVIATRSAASIAGFALVWIMFEQFNIDYFWLYIVGGSFAVHWSSFLLAALSFVSSKGNPNQKNCFEKEVLALLCPSIYGRRKKTNFCRFCSLFNGRKI